MRSQFKDCYNCAIETMQVLNKIYNQKKKKVEYMQNNIHKIFEV